MGLNQYIFIIWRFFKDKRGQMRAIDFAIALAIFLIAFSQVLGMAVNSVATVTEQTTRDHIYTTGKYRSDILLDTTGGFDWNDVSANNLQNANGYTLGLKNTSSDSPGYALHPNALARLDSESLYYLPIIDETQYGISDPYYDPSHHIYITTSDFNAHNASNTPRGERFYFGLHSIIKLNIYNRTVGNELQIQMNVTDNGELVDLQDLDLYIVAPDGTSTHISTDNDDWETAIADLSAPGADGRHAIIGISQSDTENWDYRVIFYDNNPTNYTINANATLLETTSLEAQLYSWESGNTSQITTKSSNIIFGENKTILSQSLTGNFANLGTIPSTAPIIVVVNVEDDDNNRGVNFTALPLLFDSDVRPTNQIRPVYGITPTDSTVFVTYVYNYVSVRGMIFEATVCYWRIT